MTLTGPIWLLLAIPLAVSLWVWPMPSRILRVLRISVIVLTVLAACGTAIELPSRVGTIVVLADRSLSMPPESQARQKESIDLIHAARSADDRLAVVSFGRKSFVEQPPQAGRFDGFAGEVGQDASNLADALETALSLIWPGRPGRILIVSDGRWTGRDPLGAAWRAATRGIAIDYRPLQRPSANDVAIDHVDAPQTVSVGESFMITAWVHSPVRQEISYELVRGDRRLASGRRAVGSGATHLIFRDRAQQGGACRYELKISGEGDDPVPENNLAKILVGVKGPRPMLCVSESEDSQFAVLLRRGDLDIECRSPGRCRWSLEDLVRYSAVMIENVPAEQIGGAGMENIAAWVEETGAGFVMTGGKRSYGPGGYFKSPLEPIMPVSMELRQEHRKLALAIVVAMDRSGSMSAPVGGGKTKMDLANLAAVQVLDLLSPMDEFAVVAVDSQSHVIAPLRKVEDNRQLRNKILRVASMGGGIFVSHRVVRRCGRFRRAGQVSGADRRASQGQYDSQCDRAGQAYGCGRGFSSRYRQERRGEDLLHGKCAGTAAIVCTGYVRRGAQYVSGRNHGAPSDRRVDDADGQAVREAGADRRI